MPNSEKARAGTRLRLARLREKVGGAAALNKIWKVKNHEKYIAHKKVEYAVRTGKLVRQPCEECGDDRSQAHHENYSKPLEVKWLCAKDHKKRHRQIDESLSEVQAT